jgi:TPR repeat protein
MRIATFVALAVCAACNRGQPSSGEQPPAPSSSVVTLGVALGTCPDLEACERECDAGSADRCRRLGATYAFGEGVPKDEARATALFSQACDMKDPSACMFAGQAYEFAHGVAKDDAKAASFYQRSCDLKWVAGCYNMGIMYERGTGVPRDPDKAAAMYQVACEAGAREACEKARQLATPAFFEAGSR